jgi:hypothetical protein
LEAGVGRGALAHRLETGWLREAFPSVYRLGAASDDWLGRVMAAALFFRGDAVVSGLAAASLWQMLDTTQTPADRAPVDVLLVGRSSKPRPGIMVHRVKSLARQDIRRRYGIPVASPARTVLDLAATMDDLELEAVLSICLGKNLARRAQLVDVIERNRRMRGPEGCARYSSSPSLSTTPAPSMSASCCGCCGPPSCRFR